MAAARINAFELDDHGKQVTVFEIELETPIGWKADSDHSFSSLDEARAWLSANGHVLEGQAA